MALTPLNEASSDPDVEILICSLQNHYIDSEPIPLFASSLKIRFFPLYILRWYLASLRKRRPESRMWLALGIGGKSSQDDLRCEVEYWRFHYQLYPSAMYYLVGVQLQINQKNSSVDSYCLVDNNTPCSRRSSMPSFSNRKAPQASRGGLAVELFFWALC